MLQLAASHAIAGNFCVCLHVSAVWLEVRSLKQQTGQILYFCRNSLFCSIGSSIMCGQESGSTFPDFILTKCFDVGGSLLSCILTLEQIKHFFSVSSFSSVTFVSVWEFSVSCPPPLPLPCPRLPRPCPCAYLLLCPLLET